MEFEVHEIERGFDFANLTFGSFLSAYLGVQLVEKVPDTNQMVVVSCLLGCIALLGLAVRGIALALVRGIQTKRYLAAAAISIVFGAVGYVLVVQRLDYRIEIMGPLAIGWLATTLVFAIPMISRRWIKIYE